MSAWLATPLGATIAGCVIGAFVALVFCLCFTSEMKWRGRL